MTAALFILLLASHLICMNVASAGPVLCIWLDCRNRSHADAPDTAAIWLAWKSVTLALAGALLGVLLAALKWDSHYAAVLERFESRLWWGLAEFLFSIALMAGYASWLRARPHAGFFGRFWRSATALLAATNLLYHFPTLFSLIAASAAGRFGDVTVTSPKFRELIMQAEIPAITTHFGLASIAVSGVALVYYAWRTPVPSVGQTRAAVTGARFALAATLLQVPVGLWLVMSLPGMAQQRLMGRDWLASALFLASMLATLSLLHQLAAVALGDTAHRALTRAFVVMLIVLLLMTAVLHLVAGAPSSSIS